MIPKQPEPGPNSILAKMNLAFLVPRVHVKRVKTTLEERNLLDRTVKIAASDSDSRMLISTTISIGSQGEQSSSKKDNDDEGACKKEEVLDDLGLGDLRSDVTLKPVYYTAKDAAEKNPVIKALKKCLDCLPVDLLASLGLTPSALVSGFPTTYSIYTPMLLLPPNAFISEPWRHLFNSIQTEPRYLQDIWRAMAEAVGTTHVAVNAAIPLRATTFPTNGAQAEENVLRSPIGLTPLYGDFGPPPTPQLTSAPTSRDLVKAFWVSTTQNAIHQTWAPLHTMFSRGNIREKTRLLSLPSITAAAQEVGGCTAVDLYAGIGYFAFSYKKAGVKKVLCWDINPWSLEGLRRGAEMNRWTSRSFDADTLPNAEMGVKGWEEWRDTVPDVDFLIFQESNQCAISAIETLRATVPPIRHVNLGLLPSSKDSWWTAVRALDHDLGGWLHVHENVGDKEIDEKKESIAGQIDRLVGEYEAERGSCGGYRRVVRCEHVERVKTFAPGVIHAVFDVHVGGMRNAESTI